MKIEKLKAEKRCELWEFFRENLPPSLRVAKYGNGYGQVMFVRIKERSIASYLKLLDQGIAIVRDEEVELFHPEYFSDFEDICRRYEMVTGKEVTLRYWEG